MTAVTERLLLGLLTSLASLGLCSTSRAQEAPPASDTTPPDRPDPSIGTGRPELSSSRDGFYLHAGPGALLFHPGARVRAAGAPVPGTDVRIRDDVTGVLEFGYKRGVIGVSATVGLPPDATVRGSGSLAPLGDLGRIRYGPAVVSALLHPLPNAAIRPYVGGGLVLLFVFKEQDRTLRRLDVDDHLGAAAQMGVEADLRGRFGLFMDVKRAWLRTNATGLLHGVPIDARIRLDPTVVTGGVSYRF